MTNERDWTISQRAFRLGKLMSRGRRYTTHEIREMLGYAHDSSVCMLIGALVDEPISREKDGYWVLKTEFRDSE